MDFINNNSKVISRTSKNADVNKKIYISNTRPVSAINYNKKNELE